MAQSVRNLTSSRHRLALLFVVSILFLTRFVREDPTQFEETLGSATPKLVLNGSTWNHQPDKGWCRNSSYLIYTKIPKAASTTGASIAHRIALNVAKRDFNTSRFSKHARCKLPKKLQKRSCPVIARHGKAFRSKEIRVSRLFSFVRHPVARCVSSFYHFRVSRSGMEPTDENVRESCKRSINGQVKYLSMVEQRLIPEWNRSLIEEHVLEPYDFVGLVERTDESLAVLALLWDLPLSDMLVLPAKRSGGYDDGASKFGCVIIQKPPPQQLQSLAPFFQDEFRNGNYDFELYEMANEKLDRTIASLGRERVASHVRNLQDLRQLADDECGATAVYPCSSDGVKQLEKSNKNCYVSDQGCGYPCIDAMLERQQTATSENTSAAE